MLKNKNLVILIILAIPLFLFSSIGSPHAAEPVKSVSIGTHPKGSLFNIIGSGFAKVISLHTSISASDRPFTGIITWLPLLNKGEIGLGIVGSPDLHWAYNGVKPYAEMKNLRIIGSGNGLVLGFMTRKDSGIKTIADLKGKRVGIDAGSLGTKSNQEAILRAAGLDFEKDIKKIPVAGVVMSIEAFMQGRADTAWASVGMGKVKEASAKVGGVYWLPVIGSADDPEKEKLEEKLFVNVKFFKAGSAPEMNNDTWLLDLPINLATHKAMSEDVVYKITKVIWEKENELVPIHPVFRNWTKAMVSEKATVPYHPGAIRYYKEIGEWSDTMDAVQKELLGE